MSEQLTLPLEFSNKPVEVVVKVDDLAYRFGPFTTEAQAAEMMATLVRLLSDHAAVELNKSHGSWFGTQVVAEEGRMWAIFPSQQY
jgi:hypothetical protein